MTGVMKTQSYQLKAGENQRREYHRGCQYEGEENKRSEKYSYSRNGENLSALAIIEEICGVTGQ